MVPDGKNKYIEMGVDYVTATAKSSAGRERFEFYGGCWLDEERRNGNEVREWSALGFGGLGCGAVQIGTRRDCHLLRISGSEAQRRFTVITRWATNISRLDCQSTFVTKPMPVTFAQYAFRRATLFKSEHKLKHAIRLLQDDTSGHTLYLGRRVSSTFIRVYDKFLETGLEDYRQCWRAEVQYNGRAALYTARELMAEKGERLWVGARVYSEMIARGVLLPGLPKGASRLHEHTPRVRNDAARKLEWLSGQVRPTVDWLTNRGLRSEVLKALNLENEPEVKSVGT